MQTVRLTTVIMGLGPTGLSCVRYLKGRGHFVMVTDSRDHPPGLVELKKEFPDVPVCVGGFSSSFINTADQLVLSPGISCYEPLVQAQIKRGIPLWGDIELFARDNKKPVLAITGSNGKTTVTTLLGRMVAASGYKVSVCGNIGRPVLDALSMESPDFYVIELSSFQLERTYSLKTNAAVILNLTLDHMDRYVDISDYLAAKQRIYQHCQQAIINLDDPALWQELVFTHEPIGFTLSIPKEGQFGLSEYAGQLYLVRGKSRLISANNLVLQGAHHYQNALAALAMGSAIGLPMEVMLSVLKNFKGIPHRCEFVAEKGGVYWFNDSKGTNVGATVAALESLTKQRCGGRLVLIAGGDAKGVDLSGLQTPVHDGVAYVLLFGKDAGAIAAVIGDTIPYRIVDSLALAVQQAAQWAKPGDTVLLSPACASWDMFEDYQHRGQAFVDLVRQL